MLRYVFHVSSLAKRDEQTNKLPGSPSVLAGHRALSIRNCDTTHRFGCLWQLLRVFGRGYVGTRFLGDMTSSFVGSILITLTGRGLPRKAVRHRREIHPGGSPGPAASRSSISHEYSVCGPKRAWTRPCLSGPAGGNSTRQKTGVDSTA